MDFTVVLRFIVIMRTMVLGDSRVIPFCYSPRGLDFLIDIDHISDDSHSVV